MGNSWAVGIRWDLMVMLAMGNPAVQVGDGFDHSVILEIVYSWVYNMSYSCSHSYSDT